MLGLDADHEWASAPEPRFGHAAWIYKGYMWIYGGKYSSVTLDKRDQEGMPPYFVEPNSACYLNDLWAFHLEKRIWRKVFAGGLPPGLRSDYGRSSSMIIHGSSHYYGVL